MIARLLAGAARRRAEDLRWAAFEVRVAAHFGHPAPDTMGARRAELQARFLDLRARVAADLAEWLAPR